MKKRIACAFFLLLVSSLQILPCTIISGKAKDGAVWIGNNEDWAFDFDTYLNVLPRQGKQLGAITFTYGGPDNSVQGGLNEHGLFFDFNAITPVPVSKYKDWASKEDFPERNGEFALYILRNCSTVTEALELLKRYRDPYLLGAQMHLADKAGNIAIVNADGVLLNAGQSQVSTNFNVCTGGDSADGKACWRFPIAQRLLKEHGIGLDNFRNILDATQQYRYISTIYSNIANLTTGDVYFYYAGDFQNAFHFKLDEILSRGKQSFLMRSLFPDAPIVKLWETYRSTGATKSIELFRQLQESIPEKRRSEVLRHIFLSCLMTTNKYADARVFFDEWLKVTKGQDRATNFYGAFVNLSNGQYDKAKELLATQARIDAENQSGPGYQPTAKNHLARLQLVKPAGANVRFELKGHQDAKFVSLYLPDKFCIFYFLVRTTDGWAGDFKLPAGEVNYAFMIDGQIVLDPANPNSKEYEAEDGKRLLNVRMVP